MSRFDSYIQVRLRPGAAGGMVPGGAAAVASLFVAAVHSVNASLPADKRLAVAFPKAGPEDRVDGEEGERQSPLSVMRAFGHQDLLETLLDSPRMKGLAACNGIRVSDVQDTPETDTYRRYYRNRVVERTRPQDAERRLRRAQRKIIARIAGGEVLEKHPANVAVRQDERTRLAAAKDVDNIKRYREDVYVKARSGSTEQGFSLSIRVDAVAKSDADSISTYGLASLGMDATIPHF